MYVTSRISSKRLKTVPPNGPFVSNIFKVAIAIFLFLLSSLFLFLVSFSFVSVPAGRRKHVKTRSAFFQKYKKGDLVYLHVQGIKPLLIRRSDSSHFCRVRSVLGDSR